MAASKKTPSILVAASFLLPTIGFTSLRVTAQISDRTNNIFNFMLKGFVVGGPTPNAAVRRKNQKATPLAHGGFFGHFPIQHTLFREVGSGIDRAVPFSN